MLRAPICTTSACSPIASACWASSSSVTTGRPVSSRASARISSASPPRPLNAKGDVRGLKAPPRSIEAPAAWTARATSSVCSRDSTVHGPAIRQKVSPPPHPAPGDVEHGGAVVVELAGGELVGPRDRDHAVDAAHALQAELGHALRIADGADGRGQLAGHHDHVHAGRLQPRAHGVDLGLGRVGCHHDHHGGPNATRSATSAPGPRHPNRSNVGLPASRRARTDVRRALDRDARG